MKRFSEFLIEKLNPKIVEDLLRNKDFRIGFEFEFYNETALDEMSNPSSLDVDMIREFGTQLQNAFNANDRNRDIRIDVFNHLVEKNKKELERLEELERKNPTIEDGEEQEEFFDAIDELLSELDDYDQDAIYDTWNKEDLRLNVIVRLNESKHLEEIDLKSFDDNFEREDDFLESLISFDEVYRKSSIRTDSETYDQLIEHLINIGGINRMNQIESEINSGLIFGDDVLSFFRSFREIVAEIDAFADMLENSDEIDRDNFEDYYHNRGDLPDIISNQGYDVEFDTSPQRGTDWMITTDGSVPEKEGGVEMVSPPVDIQTAIKYLEDMFEYIKDNGHTRSQGPRQCGLHMNISLKNKMENVDPVKFLLFSDEKQVSNVKLFGDRKNANYIAIVYDKLFSAALGRMAELKSVSTAEKLKKFKDIIEHEFVLFMNTKYQNINYGGLHINYSPEKRRIEVRYFGGENYEKKLELAKKVLFEILFALEVATDETKMVDEYKTRLLRLMSNLEKKSANVPKPLKDRLEKFKTQKLIQRVLKVVPNREIQLYDLIHTIWEIKASDQFEYKRFMNMGFHPVLTMIYRIILEFEREETASTKVKLRNMMNGGKEDYKVSLFDFVHILLSEGDYESFVTKEFLPKLKEKGLI